MTEKQTKDLIYEYLDVFAQKLSKLLEEKEKQLTFGDVPENSFYLSSRDQIMQKVNYHQASVICCADNLYLFAAYDQVEENEEIKKIYSITGKQLIDFFEKEG